MEINIRTNIAQLHREMEYELRDQIPYAAAVAINALAAKIVEVERAAFSEVFDKPTPFTKNALGRTYANKYKPEAIIFVKDIQARYLTPFIGTTGGMQVPHKDAILNPRNIGLDQYGNIPRNKIAQLLAIDAARQFSTHKVNQHGARAILTAQKKYFAGSVLRGGTRISGVWERPDNRKGALKLMVRFTDPKLVKEHLDYFERAQAVIDKNIDRLLRLSLAFAVDTKK